MGRTGIYACEESVSRHNSSELVVLFSLKQEALASVCEGTFTHKEESYRWGYVFPVQLAQQITDKRARLNSEVYLARCEAKLEKENYSIKRIHQIDGYKVKLEKLESED